MDKFAERFGLSGLDRMNMAVELGKAANGTLPIPATTQLRDGIAGLGLDPDKAVSYNGQTYTYTDLLTKKPLIQRGDSTAVSGMLLDILDAMGGGTKIGSLDCTYLGKATAAMKTIDDITASKDARSMNPEKMDSVAWDKLGIIVNEFAYSKDATLKQNFRNSFAAACETNYAILYPRTGSVSVAEVQADRINWNYTLEYPGDAENSFIVYEKNPYGADKQVGEYGSAMLSKSGSISTYTTPGKEYYAVLNWRGGSQRVDAAAQGTGNLEQVKANLVQLGYSYAYSDYDRAVNDFVAEHRDGNYSLKATYDRLVGNQTDVLFDWTTRAIQGSITKWIVQDLSDSINEAVKKQVEANDPNGDFNWNPSWSDACSVAGAFYNSETYDYFTNTKVFEPAPGGVIKEYEVVNGTRRLIRQYKPSEVPMGQRIATGLDNGLRLKFLKNLNSAFVALGVVAGTVTDVIAFEEQGVVHTNRQLAEAIAIAVVANGLTAYFSGILGAAAAAIVAPELPVANAVVGGLVGGVVGYFLSKALSASKLEQILLEKTEWAMDAIF